MLVSAPPPPACHGGRPLMPHWIVPLLPTRAFASHPRCRRFRASNAASPPAPTVLLCSLIQSGVRRALSVCSPSACDLSQQYFSVRFPGPALHHWFPNYICHGTHIVNTAESEVQNTNKLTSAPQHKCSVQIACGVVIGAWFVCSFVVSCIIQQEPIRLDLLMFTVGQGAHISAVNTMASCT